MLRYIYGDELHSFPKLRDTMFRDRAWQFKERLNWEVKIDAHGFERDSYDDMNPLYAIWEKADGRHGGSMRFLPTTAETMVNDHFLDLTDGVPIQSPFIWECTRFCLSENAEARVSAMLMLAALEVGLNFHLTDLVGVFDARMVRIYRRLGWEPTVLGTQGEGRDAISVGLWDCAADLRGNLLSRAGVSAEVAQHWFDRTFGRAASPAPLALVG
ncbi:Autoinducer synthesis protein raiI [Candidatus Rhodobacter oscarellae]|uniref:Acyl-homoserine-lactone synthase n=1 Tax=Candidatus Rhodobacter oscarellae TaxID=1675527 RepID=A0A0J9E9H5_9RHOB|nr:acyl-homoserine-lactone synthase [Candidatus Rhodobacter lobularis]KMW59447.1 Autoinducer synthesis protein raiI [Candidatus Rhodobacter lobularis]